MLETCRPMDIEARSFEIITELLGDRKLDPENAPVIKRAIHTTADFDYADNLVFSPHAVQTGLEALRAGCDIVTDTQMAKMQGFLSCAAFSIETQARVTPRDFASAATSGSDMKQWTSPPREARMVLLIPAFAIWVSVTISQPARRASSPVCTAWGEKTRLSA